MPPAERDASYLSDMIEAGRAIQDFIAGVDLKGFLGNRMLQAAVERKVEILGEAAGLLSEEFKKAPGGPLEGYHRNATCLGPRVW